MKLIITFTALFILNIAVAQHRENKLDSLFKNLHKAGKFHGNVLIAEKGKIIYKTSLGMANEATGTALNEHSIFELASLSKQFTAMAIALLHKQGKLKYEDSLTKYIPELHMYKGITIHHLIHHTSGLPDYMELFDTTWNHSKIATNADIISLFARHKPAILFSPGNEFRYSNTAYALLASVIEKASGLSYNQYLKAYIFDPLKMNNTFVYTRRYQPKAIQNYALGYVITKDKIKAVPDSLKEYNIVYYLDGIKGDGTINSTIHDLLLWDRALYNHQLLDRKETIQLFEPALLNDKKSTSYGFGWFIENNPQFGKIASHSGGWPGYRTFIARDMDQDKTIIILQNAEGTSLPAKAVRNILYNVAELQVINVPDSILQLYTGEYELMPGFNIHISLDANQLTAQATGQGKIKIYPSSNNSFFLKEIDAKIDFVPNEAGVINKMILHQNGNSKEGFRIK